MWSATHNGEEKPVPTSWKQRFRVKLDQLTDDELLAIAVKLLGCTVCRSRRHATGDCPLKASCGCKADRMCLLCGKGLTDIEDHRCGAMPQERRRAYE